MGFIDMVDIPGTCMGHSVIFMSPLMPLELNMDSWDPVVKDSMARFSYQERSRQVTDTYVKIIA